MSTDTLANGPVARKSLASQLDRLDGILDGLAEALGGAVSDAVRTAVGSAVRDAVEEAVSTAVRTVLLHPEVRAVLATGVAPAPPRPAAAASYATAVAGRLRDAARAARKRAAARVHGWLRGLALAAVGI